MTGYTSRTYPYPQPADAANGPANIQALATAIDSDITAIAPLYVTTFGNYGYIANPSGSVFPAASRACVTAIKPSNTISPTKFIWYCTVQSGNVDGAIINLGTGAVLWSKGSTACPATGTVTWVVAGATLAAGTTYGLVLAADNGTMATRAITLNTGGLGYMYDGSIGVGYKAASFPIPNPLAGLTIGTYVPYIELRA